MQDSIKSLFATSLAHFINDGSSYVFITLYPELLASNPLIGILAGVQNLFSVLASPIIGRRADASRKYGNLISLGLLLLGVGIIGYSVSASFASGFSLFLFLIPFAMISGVGSSFYHPLGATVLHDKWNSSSLGRAMGINGSMGSLGRATYPVIVVSLAVYFTIPSVVSLAVVAFLSIFVVSKMLGKMKFGSGENIGTMDSKKKNLEGVVSPKNSFSISSVVPMVLALTIVAFFRGFLMFGIVNFIPVYLRQVSGFQFGIKLGAVFTLVLGMAVFGQPLLGQMADKLGRRLILGMSGIVSGIAILFLLNTSNTFLEIASLAVFGFFGLTGFALILPLATSTVPNEAAVISSSIVWGIGNVGGGVVGPIVIGFLAGPAFFGSLSDAFYLATIISLASLVLLPLVPKTSSTSQLIVQRD